MFNSGMVESSSPTVELEKMDSDILSCLIRYMYSGSLKITAHNVQRLVEVYHYFLLNYISHLVSKRRIFLSVLEMEKCYLSTSLMLNEGGLICSVLNMQSALSQCDWLIYSVLERKRTPCSLLQYFMLSLLNN